MEEMKVIEELIWISREIQSVEGRNDALLGIGEALVNSGRKEEGLRILKEVLASARVEMDEALRPLMLLRIAFCMFPTCEVENILQLLREALTILTGQFDVDLEYALLTFVAIVDVWHRLEEKVKRVLALALAEFFKEFFPKISAWIANFRSELEEKELEDVWDGMVEFFTELVLSSLGHEAALEMAKGIEDEKTLSRVYGIIARELLKEGRIEEAQEIIEGEKIKYGEDALPVFREKALALARKGKIEEALSLLEEILQDLREWYENEGNDYAKWTFIDELFKIADVMREIGELGKAKALELFREIEGTVVSESGWEYFEIRGWGYFEIIGELIAEMLKIGERTEAMGKLAKAFKAIKVKESGYKKRESLEKLIKTLMERTSYEEALRLARHLEDSEIQAWMLWGISRVKGDRTARTKKLETLKEAVVSARNIKDEWERSQILALIAEDIAEEGDLDEAQWIARNIDDELERARVLLLVASLRQERGEKERGSKLAEEGLLLMEGKDYMGFSDELFARAAPLLVRGGKLNKALEILEKVRDDYYRAVALLEVARSLGEIGKGEIAKELLNGSFEIVKNLRLKTKGVKSKLLADIALEKAKIGDIEGALNIHLSYPDISGRLEGGHRCGELIRVVISERGVEEAEKVAEKIPGTRGRVQALVAIEKYIKEKGDEKGARRIREKILIDLIKHPIPPYRPPDDDYPSENRTVILLFNLDLEHDLMGSPVDIIEDTVPGNITWSWDYPPTIVGVLRYFATFPENINEEISWVMNILKSIDDEEERARGIVGLARFVSRRLRDRVGEIFEEAIEIAKSIEDLFLKENALKEIGDSLVKAERFEKAKDIGREITDKSYGVELLLEVARARSILQKGEEIGEIIDEAISEAKKIEKPWERSRALFKIAEYLIEQGNLDKAKEIAGQIEQANERNNIFVNIAKEMAKSGEIEGAINIARSIDAEIYKIRALLAIGEIISGKGESE